MVLIIIYILNRFVYLIKLFQSLVGRTLQNATVFGQRSSWGPEPVGHAAVLFVDSDQLILSYGPQLDVFCFIQIIACKSTIYLLGTVELVWCTGRCCK